MVERLAPALCGLHEDSKILTGGLLSDELIEALGTKRCVRIFVRSLGRCDAVGIGSHPNR
jgi:hypothetical protein